MSDIESIAGRLTPRLVELRKQLHQHPELAFEEHETAKAVIQFLKNLGLPVKTGIGKTGVVAVLKDARPVCSWIGSASMSARMPMVGPGFAPLSTATTPVCATPVRTSSKPSERRCAATISAVLNSRLPSSGF